MAIDLAGLDVKIFADGADMAGILALAADPLIQGFTTNPTLMRQAGVAHYEAFARDILDVVDDRPISFEVFSDDFEEMEKQAKKISTWSDNVHVKIPITDTTGTTTAALLERLVGEGVKVNVTAMLTVGQVRATVEHLAGGPHAYVSVFAGRVADTGVDPVPLMAECVKALRDAPNVELIWASPREILNVVQADRVGCHVITVTHDLLRKLPLLGRDLDEYSLETVRMFHRDAQAAGYLL